LKTQGDFETRVKEFLDDPTISKIAKTVFEFPCFFDAEATVDLKIQGKFTIEQLNVLRQAEMKLATPEEIREEEEKRQIHMNHQMIWLQVSNPKNEETKIVEVEI